MENLQHHKRDFGISAEWHFTPTAHGKSGPDGVAACFKREARRASLLAKPTNTILNMAALFYWVKKYDKDVGIYYYSLADHERMQRRLNNRFVNAERLNGIM